MILALDCATEAFSVALQDKQDKVHEHFEMAPRLHAKKLLDTIDTLLRQNQVSKKELEGLIFGKGPGSFTGVRIAVSAAQGIAQGLDIPVAGVSSLAAMAQYTYRTTGKTHIACAIDARMGEVYWGEYIIRYDRAELVGKEKVIPPSAAYILYEHDLANFIAVGSGWQAYDEELSYSVDLDTAIEIREAFPHARDMITLAKADLKLQQGFDASEAMPLYLRDKVAKTIEERKNTP